jgi:transposase InsO family protein
LDLVCTYSGWVEVYPTDTEKAQEVVKTLLRETVPRYGLPLSIGSDNGPAFMAEIVQSLVKIVKIKWKLHT